MRASAEASGQQHADALLVEPLKGAVCTTRVLVGVRTLPVLEVERRLGKGVKGVLRLRLLLGDVVILLLLNLLLLRLLSLRRGSSSGLRFLLLLRRGSESQRLLDVLRLAEDGLQRGLIDNGLEVADNVGKLGAEGGIKGNGESTLNDGCDGDVGQRDALANEEGVGREVRLKGLQGAQLTLSKSCMNLEDRGHQ